MLEKFKTLFLCSRELALFALPVVIGEVGQVMFGVGDVIVAGRYSTDVLAALGVSCGFFIPFLILGVGIMYAISPVKSKSLGALESVESFPASSLVLALGVGSVLFITIETLTFFLGIFSLQPGLEPLVALYLRITAISIIPVVIFAALKENLLAKGKTIYPNTLIIVFNVINILLNILLMIVCDMGIAGAAIATVITRSLMSYALWCYAKHKLNIKWDLSLVLMKKLLSTGISIGVNHLMAGLIFCVVAVMAGQMSVLDSAANNIVLNITSLTFMVPYALSSVCAVKVGRSYGEGDFHKMRLYSWAAVTVALAFSFTIALLFFFSPHIFAKLITNDPEVITAVTGIMFFVAIYQIPDALQMVMLGALRGAHIVKAPLIAGFVGIWCVGLPSAYYFAFNVSMGAAGLWAGLTVGLFVMAFLMTCLFLKQQRRVVS